MLAEKFPPMSLDQREKKTQVINRLTHNDAIAKTKCSIIYHNINHAQQSKAPLQFRRRIPILSSRDRTILALSPGKGFNSSLGSKCVFALPSSRDWLLLLLLFPLLFSWASLRRRASSKAARSSDVTAIAVGLRRSIFVVLLVVSGGRRKEIRGLKRQEYIIVYPTY